MRTSSSSTARPSATSARWPTCDTRSAPAASSTATRDSSLERLREEVGEPPLEVVDALIVEAPADVELGARVVGERFLQALGMRERDLVVVAARPDLHGDRQTRGGHLRRRACDVTAEEEPAPQHHQLDERILQHPEHPVEIAREHQ